MLQFHLKCANKSYTTPSQVSTQRELSLWWSHNNFLTTFWGFSQKKHSKSQHPLPLLFSQHHKMNKQSLLMIYLILAYVGLVSVCIIINRNPCYCYCMSHFEYFREVLFTFEQLTSCLFMDFNSIVKVTVFSHAKGYLTD